MAAHADGAGASVRLQGLTKHFGAIGAVEDVGLTIPSGQFVTLLGPSGSGKTTTLNLIAGFLAPDRGEIFFDDRPVSAVPAHKRDIGMVFQSYALFPHMTVFDNVAFPLRMRTRLDRSALRRRVHETLDLVRLAGFEGRYPRQLSGGQQQRVSMARALVSQPRLLLMDEPLGALDKKLRDQMQLEIKRIHRSVGSTFVYVTHDQSEALTMSDMVVVMKDGRIAEAGSPRTLYESPRTEFVADFLGAANLIDGVVEQATAGDLIVRTTDGHRIEAAAPDSSIAVGDAVRLLLRPEDLRLFAQRPTDDDGTAIQGRIAETAYLGDMTKIIVDVGGVQVSTRVESRRANFRPDDDVWVGWPRQSVRVLRITRDV